MKKKFVFLLLLCVIFSITAGADMIVSEQSNDFMREHADECVKAYRNFTVNSPKGGAYLYDRPNGEVVDTVQNGTVVPISATWDNGTWGITYCYPSLGMTYDAWAWVKLEDVVAVYDEYSFDEEFAGSYYQDDALVQQFADSLQGDKMILRYKYPGWEASIEWRADRILDDDTIEYLFKDEKGLVWGRLASWKWWSDPYAQQEAVDRQKEFERYPSWEEQGIDPMALIKTEKRNERSLAITLVAGVAVVSLVQIVLIRKKKKQKAAG